ncbi:MAG: XdhC family protein [Acidimicrobiales bacterium]
MVELARAIASRQKVVLATIVDTNKSVPRRPGSKMLVYPDGTISGTIGGGEMESRAIAEALEALESAQPRRLSYSLVDAAAGDPGICGGDVELFLEPHMPQPTLYVLGIGHVGSAVAELARWLGYRVIAWDDRPEIASSVAGLDVSSESIVDVLKEHPIDEHTKIVMTTRSVSVDVEVLPALLATPATFVGIMGSKRRWETTRETLLTAGQSAESLARVHSPIGIDISAETPTEIAVAVLAEVIAHERDGT